MKERIDSIVEAIIKSYHVYCDAWLGIVLTAVATFLFANTFTIKLLKEPASPIDTPRFFPQLVFGMLIPIGIVLIFRGFMSAKKNRETVPEGEELTNSVMAFERGFVALASITIFISLIEPLGFILAAIIYMLFSMFFMSAKEGWKPVIYVVAAIVVALACYFIFRQFVYVHLPDGILRGVLN